MNPDNEEALAHWGLLRHGGRGEERNEINEIIQNYWYSIVDQTVDFFLI